MSVHLKDWGFARDGSGEFEALLDALVNLSTGTAIFRSNDLKRPAGKMLIPPDDAFMPLVSGDTNISFFICITSLNSLCFQPYGNIERWWR